MVILKESVGSGENGSAEEVIDIDLNDKGVQDAAAKIQNVFRKKKA